MRIEPLRLKISCAFALLPTGIGLIKCKSNWLLVSQQSRVRGLGFLTGSADSRLFRGGDDIVMILGRSGEDAEQGAGAARSDKTTGTVIGGSSSSTRRR